MKGTVCPTCHQEVAIIEGTNGRYHVQHHLKDGHACSMSLVTLKRVVPHSAHYSRK